MGAYLEAARPWVVRLLAAIVIVACLVVLVAAVLFLSFYEDDTWTPPDLSVAVADVAREPSAFVGDRVLLRGVIAELPSEHLMRLTDPLEPARSVLIATAQPLPVVLGQPHLSPEALENFAGDYVQVGGVVEAASVAEVPEAWREVVQGAPGAEGPLLAASTMALLPPARLTAADVAHVNARDVPAPRQFGVPLAITGSVTDHPAPSAVVLDGNLLVVLALPLGPTEMGQVVEVLGEFRELDIDAFERSLALDLDEDALEPWEGSVVLLGVRVRGLEP